MKILRQLVGACLLLATLPAFGAVHTLQVTVTASAAPVIPATSHIYVKWVVFQDNATHSVRIGDSNITSSRGMQLLAGGSFYTVASSAPGSTDLNSWYVVGTAADVLDIIYDDGQ